MNKVEFIESIENNDECKVVKKESIDMRTVKYTNWWIW